MLDECILNIIRDICCCVCLKENELLENVHSEPDLPVQSQPQRSQLPNQDYTQQVQPRHSGERIIVPRQQSTKISSHQVKSRHSDERIIVPHRQSTQISTPQVKPGHSERRIIDPHRQSTQISILQVKPGYPGEKIIDSHRQFTETSIHQSKTIIDKSIFLDIIGFEVPHWGHSSLECLTNRFSNEWIQISKDFGVRKTVILNIESIYRIQDRLMLCQYLLRKEELINRYGEEEVREMRLYHGTIYDRAISIFERNFDWRKCGWNDSSNHGRGVYFSPNAAYASNYGNQFLILSKVLIGPSIEGTRRMKLPPYGYQCTRKRDGIEYVLYNDDEFYPEFLIVYNRRPRIILN